MKNLTFIFLILLFGINCIAQDQKLGATIQVNTPSKDEINIGWFNIDSESIDEYNLKHRSYSLGIMAQYAVNKEMRVRLRFGYTHIGITEYSNYDLLGVNFDESMDGSQSKFHIAPAIYWPVSFENIEFYGGFEIPFNRHGDFIGKYDYAQTNLSDNSVIYEEHSTLILPKGYSIGIAGIFGFNYVPVDWFSLGAEFAPSLLYAKLSGKTIWTDQNGNTYNTQDENRGIGFYDQRFSINLNFWF